MIEVELPDGRVVEIDTDDPQQAAKAARRFMQSNQQQPAADTPQAPATQPVTNQQPEQAQPEQEQPGFMDRVGEAISGAASGIAEMFTGEQRTGRDIERTPSLFEGDFLADLPAGEKAKIVGLAQITSDPNELAKIVAQQVPGTQIQYNRDEQGNVYPVLRRPDGRAAMVDKPGVDLLNVAQFAGDMAMFTPAGRATTVGRGIAGAAATEATRQGVQQTAGGEFDQADVALSGGIEGVGRFAEKGIGAVARGMTGQPTEEVADVIRAGEEFDVPVMTSDVVPPRTAMGRAAQMLSETVPVVGTGGKRAAQQESREAAVDQFIDRYQGGSYEQIINSLKAQKDNIKSRAGSTYQRLTPKLNTAIREGRGIEFDNTLKAIEEAREKLVQPGREVSPKALDLLERIQETTQVADQSFSTLKSNISAWQEAMDAIDPAMRDQLPSADKRVIQSVLRSLRDDRDEFAKKVLSANEYRQLKNADQAYGEMANELKNTRIKNVLNKGDLTPEVVRNMLFSNKPSEVRQIYQGLTNEGRSNARATIITDIANRLSRRASGLTPDALATELGKNKEVLDIFFRGPRRQELKGFLRLLNATRRAQKAETTFSLPTGQQTIPLLVGAGAAIEPQLAAAYGSIGAIGRLYEHPRVRNILSRMASVDPGSTQFEQLMQLYREEAVRVAQSIRSQESDDDTNPNQ